MDDHKELIDRLTTDREWAQANEWESPICLQDDLSAAITMISALTATAEELERENQGLRANKAIMEKILEGKHNPHDMATINQQMLENAQLRTELEQVKRERESAVADLLNVCDHPGEINRRLTAIKWRGMKKEK